MYFHQKILCKQLHDLNHERSFVYLIKLGRVKDLLSPDFWPPETKFFYKLAF